MKRVSDGRNKNMASHVFLRMMINKNVKVVAQVIKLS